MNSLSLDSSFFFFFFFVYIYVCVCYSSASLFTGSLGAFIHRVCARSSFFFVARWVTSRKEETTKKKKLEGMDWCIGEYTIKKAKKKKEEATETRKDKALGERARRKKREVRGDWLVHFDNWNEDDKEMLSPVRREKKERWKETLFAFDRKKREKKKCVYTESGQRHVPPNKSHCIHFPVIRASSSSRLHIYIYII